MSKKPLIFALLISLFGHCLFLFIPRFDFIPSPLKEWKDVLVEVEIEKPQASRSPSHQVTKSPENKEQKTESRKQKEEIREKKKEKFITKRVPKVSKEPQFKRKEVGKPPRTMPTSRHLRGRHAIRQKAKSTEPREKKKIEKENYENYGGLPSIVKDNKALLRYQDRVKQKIESCKKYPRWAKRQGFEGIVYLSFTILANGEAKNIRIVQPSQFDILNREAIATVNRASPFLPIPEDFNRSYVEMEVAIVFKLR